MSDRIFITVGVTPEQKTAFRAASHERGLSEANYARRLMFGGVNGDGKVVYDEHFHALLQADGWLARDGDVLPLVYCTSAEADEDVHGDEGEQVQRVRVTARKVERLDEGEE